MSESNLYRYTNGNILPCSSVEFYGREITPGSEGQSERIEKCYVIGDDNEVDSDQSLQSVLVQEGFDPIDEHGGAKELWGVLLHEYYKRDDTYLFFLEVSIDHTISVRVDGPVDFIRFVRDYVNPLLTFHSFSSVVMEAKTEAAAKENARPIIVKVEPKVEVTQPRRRFGFGAKRQVTTVIDGHVEL